VNFPSSELTVYPGDPEGAVAESGGSGDKSATCSIVKTALSSCVLPAARSCSFANISIQ
jgi:hypothetical protein